MQVTDAMVAKAAQSDAEFDGRTWLAMPKSERERYMERSRRSLTAALAEMWRPIEEAPKDGSNLLAYGEQHGTVLAYWANWFDNIAGEDREGWMELGSYDKLPELTHFMPPPRAAEGEVTSGLW